MFIKITANNKSFHKKVYIIWLFKLIINIFYETQNICEVLTNNRNVGNKLDHYVIYGYYHPHVLSDDSEVKVLGIFSVS